MNIGKNIAVLTSAPSTKCRRVSLKGWRLSVSLSFHFLENRPPCALGPCGGQQPRGQGTGAWVWVLTSPSPDSCCTQPVCQLQPSVLQTRRGVGSAGGAPIALSLQARPSPATDTRRLHGELSRTQTPARGSPEMF